MMSSSQRVPPRKEIALASKASNSSESTCLLEQHTVGATGGKVNVNELIAN